MPNPNEFNTNGSVPTGSPTNDADKGAGTSTVSSEQFANLEKLVGTQGKELGDYRQFFADVSPLLDKLDKNPELVQAIIDGKIDTELVKAALDGKITYKEATVITQANAEVKKDLGTPAYNQATPEEISALIEEKVSIVKKDMQNSLKDMEDIRNFESSVNDFITRTPDFSDYAKAIDAWLDEHDITDIEVAYYAVKGQVSERDAKKLANEDKAEYEKNLALNAGGGGSRVTYSGADGERMVDQLIAGRTNPNTFG